MIATPLGMTPRNRTVAIVQARMGSERLPGKMLLGLGGKTLIQHVVDRLMLCNTLHHIVVATPDEELAKKAYEYGVWGYLDTGDPNNVLSRYIKAASWSGARIVVRITGDCPLTDPQLVDRCVNECVEGRFDLVSNVLRRRYPRGMDVEVMHLNVLKRIYHLTDDARYREHVTLFAYENPALFSIKNVSPKYDFSHLNLCVDTKYDLDKLEFFMKQSNYDGQWTVEQIINWFLDWEAKRPF